MGLIEETKTSVNGTTKNENINYKFHSRLLCLSASSSARALLPIRIYLNFRCANPMAKRCLLRFARNFNFRTSNRRSRFYLIFTSFFARLSHARQNSIGRTRSRFVGIWNPINGESEILQLQIHWYFPLCHFRSSHFATATTPESLTLLNFYFQFNFQHAKFGHACQKHVRIFRLASVEQKPRQKLQRRARKNA